MHCVARTVLRIALTGVPGVLLRVLIEFVLTALTAKVVRLRLMFGLRGGFMFIHLHSANRINLHSH